jgi:hypothetical protein
VKTAYSFGGYFSGDFYPSGDKRDFFGFGNIFRRVFFFGINVIFSGWGNFFLEFFFGINAIFFVVVIFSGGISASE